MGAPVKLTKVTVATGRTLYVPGTPTETKDGDKVAFSHSRGKYYGPKEAVLVPADQVDELKSLGFIHDPSVIAPAVGEGPTFSAESGPSIQSA